MSSALPPWVREDRHYDSIPRELWFQLQNVPASRDQEMEYRPCMVTLADGRTHDTVYVVPKVMYITMWGVWPEDDALKRSVPIREVTKIQESPRRLPARWANYIYEGGETAMGGTLFAVRFCDGAVQRYDGGNAVDFIDLPGGRSVDQIVGIDRHVRTGAPASHVLPYTWCIYDGVEGEPNKAVPFWGFQ